jgi:hypothetical protein
MFRGIPAIAGGLVTHRAVEYNTVMSCTENTSVLIGGESGCTHELRSYLGHMGPTAIYQCDVCEGVITC